MQISRYAVARAADHGVAFPDLLNHDTEADEGYLHTTHEIVPSFFNNKPHGTENGSRHMSNDIVAKVNYRFR